MTLGSIAMTNSPYYTWRNKITDMLFISHLSTHQEIEYAYLKEKNSLEAVIPRNELEKKLLFQKLNKLEQVYKKYKQKDFDDDSYLDLDCAYEEAAIQNTFRLAAVPFVIWLVSRIINVPMNWLTDCTRCSCCGDQSCLVFISTDCCKNAYDNSSFLKITDTVLLVLTAIAGAFFGIRHLIEEYEYAQYKKNLRLSEQREREQHKQELQVYQQYYNKMLALEMRYEFIKSEYSNIPNMPETLDGIYRLISKLEKDNTDETLDYNYKACCEKITKEYIFPWESTLRHLKEDVKKTSQEKPILKMLTKEETEGLGKFSTMLDEMSNLKIADRHNYTSREYIDLSTQHNQSNRDNQIDQSEKTSQRRNRRSAR